VPTRRVPLSLILPILSLAIWIAVVLIPTTLTYVYFLQKAQGAPSLSITLPLAHLNLPRAHFLSFAADRAAYRFGHAMLAINIPATAIELPIDRFTSSWPSTRVPSGMHFESWRAVIYPFYCLPFWWCAGVGLDALLRRRQLRWPWLLVGTLLWGFIVFITMGFTFGLSAEDHRGNAYIFWGLGFWCLLLAAYPTTWIRTGLAYRRSRRVPIHDSSIS